MTTPPPHNDPKRMFRGASAVRYAVAKSIKDQYKEARNRCLNAWQMPGKDLPAIEAFSPFDVIQSVQGQLAVLGVEITSNNTFRKTDHNEYGSEEFRPTYSVRVTVWCQSQTDDEGGPISPSRELLIRQRDDQLALLRGIILARPSLGTETMEVKIASLSETYLPPTPTPNNSKRWIVPGQLAFDVQADEWLTFDAVGHVVETGVETEVLLKPERPEFPNIDRLP